MKRSQAHANPLLLLETDPDASFRPRSDILDMNRSHSPSPSAGKKNSSIPKFPAQKLKHKSVVDQIRERHRLPNPWRVGEVVQVIVKGNPDLRGRGGQWGVIVEVLEFSCIVRVWDGVLQVKIEQLQELPYSLSQKKEMQAISDRLAKIPVQNTETSIKAFLAGLGSIQRPFLTQTEETLLTTLESFYNGNGM